jgi:hypothetical protein
MNYVVENEDFEDVPTGLVTLREIQSIDMICPGAKIKSIAHVDGWQVVVPRGEFEKGNVVLFFAPDAFVPSDLKEKGLSLLDPSEMDIGVEEKFQGQRGYRSTIQRVGNVFSQGAIAHTDMFPHIAKKIEDRIAGLGITIYQYLLNISLRQMSKKEIDFTGELGVLKWRLDNYTALNSLGSNPRFIPKVDITNANDCPNFFIKPKYTKTVYQETSKMDGATMTVYFIKYGSKHEKSLNALPKYFDRRMVQ